MNPRTTQRDALVIGAVCIAVSLARQCHHADTAAFDQRMAALNSDHDRWVKSSTEVVEAMLDESAIVADVAQARENVTCLAYSLVRDLPREARLKTPAVIDALSEVRWRSSIGLISESSIARETKLRLDLAQRDQVEHWRQFAFQLTNELRRLKDEGFIRTGRGLRVYYSDIEDGCKAAIWENGWRPPAHQDTEPPPIEITAAPRPAP